MKKLLSRTSETHPLTWRLNAQQDTVWIKEYKRKNGYRAFEKVVNHMTSEDVIDLIKQSGLKGRGGAGFLTGLKWSLMPPLNDEYGYTRYLLCNADEMEPGTYKDRFLMEKVPHQLLEGILISAFALSVTKSYIFLRGEYVNTERILKQSIIEATNYGYLGKNVCGSNLTFEIFIHTGAGRYICGEETALINSLEGRRANPRFKPPFPAYVGLWGKPTCVNNVETLSNVPAIFLNGVKWYKGLSKSLDTGTKMMGFSGSVKFPGIWELPFGITAREIFERYAGGMKNNKKLKVWQPGGASTSFLIDKHLDVPMDFVNIKKVGSRLGTALAMAVDDSVSIVSLVRNIEEFFSRESCGFCTPCRDGLPWIVKILKVLEQKIGVPEDIEILEQLCEQLGPGRTFCAHAPGAIEPLKSALKYFRLEFELCVNSNSTIKCKYIHSSISEY
ncbi:NADH dehydrogenase I chain F [Buchnera aphidicola str. Bp (Baizongia pistaciae)]|uniref:NADH-quinone oxidoreductase subunit F n=1 Tax=Buchnera aphidicola subsp. Baizongia pistaciae (strain Bp) TaxID=224915 RepID=NUOF_BUCBP|nr:NADH-quinone oxidoreductase subunit NuoF [Buchnera aphidicola]Q89AU2.1 RecName: Full=NADH-quinone oxidoreductase subunit F; AltName: Full=NADH dehydrogenase I subunit F; AltName: Full=NDH-1 subunit F [Buchnera aphidicola str. Bp (Baizongia pistaciae)]AAO26881.1 NADH dehydrogenase I chain F [Buchnera aphidicola str. Bp (Baizongia pistaciae)]